MARRDAFTNFHEPLLANHDEGNHVQDPSMTPRQPLDLIPTAGRKKKRSRNWERVHRSETVTYRGIPRTVVEQIIQIAESLSVPRDEVVRAFLEYGIKLYRSGEINLYATPKSQRMTLFPERRIGNSCPPSPKIKGQSWLSEAFPVPEKKLIETKKNKSKKHQDSIRPWEMRVTFRIPVELKEEVRAIAVENLVPVGEVVWYFVLESVKAYQKGKLRLQPSPKVIGRTLFREGQE